MAEDLTDHLIGYREGALCTFRYWYGERVDILRELRQGKFVLLVSAYCVKGLTLPEVSRW